MGTDERGLLAIDELLARDGEEFVRGAYRLLLGREPDPGGLGNYLEELLGGTPKLDLLAAIASSAEGRRHVGALSDATLAACEQVRSMRRPGAASLEELLAHHDEPFVRCAYLVLLGRDADAEGLSHYVEQLRAGYAKMRVLSALRASAEGRLHAAGTAGVGCEHANSLFLGELDAALTSYRWASIPVLGRALGAWFGVEGDSPMQMRLRRLENELYLLGDPPRQRSLAVPRMPASGPLGDARGNTGTMPAGASTEAVVMPAPNAASLLLSLPSVDGVCLAPERQ